MTEDSEQESAMFNMNNKKTRQKVSAVIVILLVLAMLIPTLSYLIY
ncbi:MAG: hypothetical protein HFH87_06700 [Lachnospiraceae bacterium]|nr:hypothetical protein [Lachnospiraceae bacterium]